MGKGNFIAIAALLIAVAGAIVAFAAYFKRRNCMLCDDFDDMADEDSADLDYYATQVDDDDCDFKQDIPVKNNDISLEDQNADDSE